MQKPLKRVFLSYQSFRGLDMRSSEITKDEMRKKGEKKFLLELVKDEYEIIESLVALPIDYDGKTYEEQEDIQARIDIAERYLKKIKELFYLD